jgi:predicted nucleic acid-binding protein
VHFCTVTALGLMSEGDFSARLCTDAYLSALTISNGWRLVSFDRRFERFGDLQRLKLNGTSSA